MNRSSYRTLAALAAGATMAAGLSLLAAVPTQAVSAAEQPTIRGANSASAVAGEYVVVFENQGLSVAASRRTANEMAAEHGGQITYRYGSAIDGYAAKMTEKQALDVAADPQVAYVEQSVKHVALDVQPNPPNWGDDRIDQRNLPLDQSYTYPANPGLGAHVYVIDTGINTSHNEFTGRVGNGRDTVDNDDTATDCHGHGTHVAGTAVGTTYGVAKKATVHPVRSLNCQGSGTTTGLVAGFDWVTANAIKPAVVNYSVGCQSRCPVGSINDAVNRLMNGGVSFVQAAGNANDDACYYGEKSNLAAITVGSMTSTDARSSFSNWGTCLDLFAPGSSIISAWYTSNTATNTISGTSMASPHVAGVAALYLGQNTGATQSQVQTALVNNSTPNVLTGIGTGSPNRLLYMGFLNGTPSGVTVANPGNQTSTVGTAVNLTNSATGGTAPYTWSATGLPAGLSISSSTGTISGTPTTAGTSNVTITARDSSSPQKTGSASFTWTVNPVGGGCAAKTNGTDYAINDFSTIESPITISGCSGNASSTSKVAVNIVHTYIGDLKVDLIAPDGSVYVLHNRSGGSADNINTTYTVNLSSEVRNGTWKLRVNDNAWFDTGRLDTWTLTL
jgi:subtilisin family serine protease